MIPVFLNHCPSHPEALVRHNSLSCFEASPHVPQCEINEGGERREQGINGGEIKAAVSTSCQAFRAWTRPHQFSLD